MTRFEMFASFAFLFACVLALAVWQDRQEKRIRQIERVTNIWHTHPGQAVATPCVVAWWSTDQTWVYHEAKPGTVIVNTFDPCPTDQGTTR